MWAREREKNCVIDDLRDFFNFVLGVPVYHTGCD